MALPSNIARYTVVQPIAAGGMGEVFLARDEKLDRLVAIKLLREGFDSPDLHQRFEEEARNVAKLTHPNIVTIYEFGTHETRPYIAMEYIAGHSLAEIIKRQLPISVARRVRLIEEVCSGLAHAHKAHLVHRDVKPANLMMTTSGMVKVLDFGIAKLRGTERTQKGMIVGTVNYMSPEQITGQPVDHRSDVFAVGAVLYEILTYEQAFKGDLTTAMFGIVHGQPDPLAVRCPGLDPSFQAVVDKCLAKSPDDRYQDLSQLKRELGRLRRPLEEAEEADVSDTVGPLDVDQTIVVKAPKPPSTISGKGPGPDTRRALGSALASGEAAIAAGQFESAIRYAEQALALESQNVSAQDLMARAVKAHEAARVASQLRLAREALGGDRLDDARAALDAATALAPESDTVRAFARQLDQRAADLAHFERTVVLAREKFEARDFKAARDLTQTIAHIRPEHSALKRLQDEIERADAKYQAWLSGELAAIDDLVGRQHLEAALARAEGASAKAPQSAELATRAAQVRAARDAQIREEETRRRDAEERQKAEEARTRRIAALLAQAQRTTDPLAARRDAAAELVKLEPGHGQAAALLSQLSAEIEAADKQRALERARKAAEAEAAAEAARRQRQAADEAKRQQRAAAQARVMAMATDWRAMSGVGAISVAVLAFWLWPSGPATVTPASSASATESTTADAPASDTAPNGGPTSPGADTPASGQTTNSPPATPPGTPATTSPPATTNSRTTGTTIADATPARPGATDRPADPPPNLLEPPPVVPARPRVVTAGTDVPPPARTRFVEPVYPPRAMAARTQGTVTADITVGVDGAVTGASVRRSVPGLDAAAVAAVRQWRYQPSLKDGQPVIVRMTVDVPFTLAEPATPETRTADATPPRKDSPPPPKEEPRIEATPEKPALERPAPPPPAVKVDEGAALRQADLASLGALINQFGTAYQTEDLTALKSAWPQMPRSTESAYRNVFQSYSKLGWTLQGAKSTIADDRSKATAVCDVQVALTELRSNATRYERRSYRFSFERRGSGWTVVNVENLGAVR